MGESHLYATQVCYKSLVGDCIEDGNYCMTCGQDRSICLWNPDRDDMKDGFLIKRYKGPHSYVVNDICMYS